MGYGIWAPYLAADDFTDLYGLPPWTGDESSPRLAQDWYLSGLSAPAPTQIPWAWLAPALRLREDRAVTYASVTRGSDPPSIASVPADEQTDFTANLDTLSTVDAPNLAHFMITYYANPRTRCAQLRLILNPRTQTEQWLILGAGIGDRILLTGVPVGWPTGADNLVIEGISHVSTTESREVTWSTSPVIGQAPGQVGPFFRLGVSVLGGTDLLPW